MWVERGIMLNLSCRINSFNGFCLEWVSKECSHTTCTAAQQHAMFLHEQLHRKLQLRLLISYEQNKKEKSLHLKFLCSHYNIVVLTNQLTFCILSIKHEHRHHDVTR